MKTYTYLQTLTSLSNRLLLPFCLKIADVTPLQNNVRKT